MNSFLSSDKDPKLGRIIVSPDPKYGKPSEWTDQQQFVDAMSIPHSKDSFHNLAKEIDLPPIQKKQKIMGKRNRKRSKNKE